MSLTVIILCGGHGRRLRPLTLNTPKPLIKVNKKTILEIIIEHLSKTNVERVILVTGYKSSKFYKYSKIKFKDSYIKVFNTGNVDIIERIKKCFKKNLINDDFMVLYGDTITNINVNRLIKFHKKNKKLATVCLTQYRSQFGLMSVNNNNSVYKYQEKPLLNYWINIGYFFFSKKTIPIIKKFNSFIKFLIFIVTKKQLSGYKHLSDHYTVNNYEELVNLKKIFINK